MLKKLGLSKALLILVLGMVGFSAIQSVFMLVRWQSQSSQSVSVAEDFASKSQRLIEVEELIAELHTAIPNLFIEKDIDRIESSVTTIQNLQSSITQKIEACGQTCLKFTETFLSYVKSVKVVIEEKILLGKNAEAVEYYITDMNPQFIQMLEGIKATVTVTKSEMNDELARLKHDTAIATQAAGIATLAISIFMIVLGFYLRRTMISAINQVTQELDVTSNDVAISSQTMAASGHSLANASRDQAAAVQETSSAMEQIQSTVAQTLENIRESLSNSEKSVSRINEGRKAISEMLNAMNNISSANANVVEQFENNNREFTEIVNVIKTITDKTQVINDIVFQTKLLSFNASVEAARAGEAGKGFAVVAQEIGNLAVMSGNSAAEISEALMGSSKRVASIAEINQIKMQELVQVGQNAVANGTEKAQNCDEVFNGISQDAHSIQSILMTVTQSISEQSTGINEVNKAMSSLETQTQSNSNIADESAQVSSDLERGSIALKGTIESLRQLVVGT